jgi:NADPH:quinone reductase-like Zn-dependent oxidoreductase
VRIKVSAAGVNFADVQMRMGLYPEAPRVPFVPGYEVAGVISEVGPGAEGFRRGQRVLSLCRFGGYTDEIVLPAGQVRPTPRRLSDREAAAVPVAFATAWIALVDMARIREGDRVLVPGAAGGVGTALVQIASCAGAQVVGLVGNAGKKDLVRSLGASEVLTYDELQSRAGLDGRQFTVIAESRGASALKDSMRRLAPGGRVVSYGVSSIISGHRRSIPRTLLWLLRTPLFTNIGLQMSNSGMLGLNMLKLIDSDPGRDMLMHAMDGVLDGFQSGRYKPVLGRTFPLRNAGDAHTYLQTGKSTGKVVLICS